MVVRIDSIVAHINIIASRSKYSAPSVCCSWSRDTLTLGQLGEWSYPALAPPDRNKSKDTISAYHPHEARLVESGVARMEVWLDVWVRARVRAIDVGITGVSAELQLADWGNANSGWTRAKMFLRWCVYDICGYYNSVVERRSLAHLTVECIACGSTAALTVACYVGLFCWY